MKLVRLGDISIAFSDDESLVLRSFSRGIAARVPGPALAVLSYCDQPRSADEVEDAFGPAFGRIFGALQRAGFLVSSDAAGDTPVFFENYASVDVHRRMLGDRVRLDAYRAALEEVVEPGMAVLDAGTGSGILACLAAKAGARVVYAVDRSDMVDVARDVVKRSGLEDKVKLIRGDFATVELPEKVDLIVSETFGQFALSEGGGPDLEQARAAHLAAGGRVMPESLELYMAPVSSPELYAETVEPFDDRYGVDLTALREAAMRRARTEVVPQEALLHPGAQIVELPWPNSANPVGDTAYQGLRSGKMHGLVGWFALRLSKSVRLSTGPRDDLTHWKQAYFPMPEIDVPQGAEMIHRIECTPSPGDRRGYDIKSDWALKGEGLEIGGTMVHKVR